MRFLILDKIFCEVFINDYIVTVILYYRVIKKNIIIFYNYAYEKSTVKTAISVILRYNYALAPVKVKEVRLLFYLKNTISSVAITISAKPINAFLVNFSLNTIKENATVTNMLNLSIGTTTLTIP